jgi:phospholipid transport system transporter-binding protein
MTHPQWHPLEQGQIELSGALDRETVPGLWQFLQQWQPTDEQIMLSLENVVRVDSAGMVLLIHLIEHAKKRNCHIMLSFVPEQLQMLFQLSNVESLVTNHISE